MCHGQYVASLRSAEDHAEAFKFPGDKEAHQQLPDI